MAKQTVADRLARLQKGRCPIHGRPLSQVAEWRIEKGRPVTIAACSCGIAAKQDGLFRPAMLLPQFTHLLEPQPVPGST